MKLTFLGTGTSTGVPQMRCRCATCTSDDPRDKRLRTSALVTLDSGANILIDCGPDFRAQMLAAGCPDLAALLVTHSHYDHVGGIDDLRPYCPDAPDGHFPVYCQADVATDLRNRVPYCFAEKLYPGVPTYAIHEISPGQSFRVAGDEIIPLPVLHYRLPIVGFRIGGLSYVTDCKTMPASTIELMRGTDTLVINALRHQKHISHLNLREALDVIKEVAPRRAFLTHISHDMGRHAETCSLLPEGVEEAFDGMTAEIP